MNCTCGHVEDERKTWFLSACQIEDCDCVLFDWDGAEDSE